MLVSGEGAAASRKNATDYGGRAKSSKDNIAAVSSSPSSSSSYSMDVSSSAGRVGWPPIGVSPSRSRQGGSSKRQRQSSSKSKTQLDDGTTTTTAAGTATSASSGVCRLSLTRDVLSCGDLTPLFMDFVGYHLFQRGVLPCPIEHLISSSSNHNNINNNINSYSSSNGSSNDSNNECKLDKIIADKSSRKRLEKFILGLQNSLSALSQFIQSDLQGLARSVSIQLLLGPSASHPKSAYTLSIDTASSSVNNNNNNNFGTALPYYKEIANSKPDSPTNSYISKLIKAMTRQMLVNSEVFEDKNINIPIRSIFFAAKIELYPGMQAQAQAYLSELGSSAEHCPLFQYFAYREGFQPKFRKNCKEMVVSLCRDDRVVSPSNGENECTDAAADVDSFDFVLKKGISVVGLT